MIPKPTLKGFLQENREAESIEAHKYEGQYVTEGVSIGKEPVTRYPSAEDDDGIKRQLKPIVDPVDAGDRHQHERNYECNFPMGEEKGNKAQSIDKTIPAIFMPTFRCAVALASFMLAFIMILRQDGRIGSWGD